MGNRLNSMYSPPFTSSIYIMGCCTLGPSPLSTQQFDSEASVNSDWLVKNVNQLTASYLSHLGLT